MNEAQGAYLTAIESTTGASFPGFLGENPRWLSHVTELRMSAQRRTAADAKRQGDAAPTIVDTHRVHWPPKLSNANIDGGLKRPPSPANSVTSDGASSVAFSAVGSASSAKSARTSDDGPLPTAMGAEKHRVLVNDANVLRVTFPTRYNGGIVMEYNAPRCRLWLRQHEGTDAKCLCAAVSKSARTAGRERYTSTDPLNSKR